MGLRGGVEKCLCAGVSKTTLAYLNLKDKLIGILAFFRLLDENKQISLTNLAVIIVLIKMWDLKELDLTAASTLLGVIGAYQFKRYIQRGK
jgi:hypothetical protein